MKNLLTKTLFISLLSSAVIPSNVQANFSDVAKKIFQVTTRTGVLSGATAGGVATLIAIVPEKMNVKGANVTKLPKILITLALGGRRLVIGTLAGAAVGGLVELLKQNATVSKKQK